MRKALFVTVIMLGAVACEVSQVDRYGKKAKVGDDVSKAWFVDAHTGNCIRIESWGRYHDLYIADHTECIPPRK